MNFKIKIIMVFLFLIIFTPTLATASNIAMVDVNTNNETKEISAFNDKEELTPIKDYSSVLKQHLLEQEIGDIDQQSYSSKIAITSSTYIVGDSEVFWAQDSYKAWNGEDDDSDGITDFDEGDWDEAMYELTAICKYVGDHSYIFIDGDLGSTYDSYAEDLANEFDNNIYPIENQYFGDTPDIDNNDRIIILIFDIRDYNYYGQSSSYVAGYFWALHTYNPSGHDSDDIEYYSEYKEIIHIDTYAITSGIEYATIAHETQHLIHYDTDKYEEVWLDEGCATYAEFLCGYEEGLEDYVTKTTSYLANTDSSLTYWESNMRSYGHVFLFMAYLSEHYGGAETISDIIQSLYHGMDSITRVLMSNGHEITAEELYTEWATANAINDPLLADKYYYPASDLLTGRLASYYTTHSNYPIDSNVLLKYWGTRYIKLPDITGSGEIEVSTLATDSKVGAVIVTKSDTSVNIDNIQLENGHGSLFFQYDETITDAILILMSFDGTTSGAVEADPVPTRLVSYSIIITDIIGYPGNITFSPEGEAVKVNNIQLLNTNGTIIEDTDVVEALYYLKKQETTEAVINGTLEWYADNKTWSSIFINIEGLDSGNYQFLFEFNLTSRVIHFLSEEFSISDYYQNYVVDYNVQEQYIQLKAIEVGLNPSSLWEDSDIDSAEYELFIYSGLAGYTSVGKSGDLIWEYNKWKTPQISTKGLENGTYIFKLSFVIESEEIQIETSSILLNENQVDNAFTFFFTNDLLILSLSIFGFIYLSKKLRKN